MDYGKMAYIKVDELEQRLAKNNMQERKFKSVYALCQPRKEIRESNGYFAAYIAGSNSVSLVVKVVLNVKSSGVLKLLIGGIPASSAEISQSGRHQELFVQSILTFDAARLELSAHDGLLADVLNVEITLSGINAEIIKTADAFALDGEGGNIAVIRGKDERLEFVCGDIFGSAGTDIGFGSACDIVAVGQNDYRATYIDSFKNAWGLVLNKAGETQRNYLLQGLQSVAITSFEGKIVIGFVDAMGSGYFTTDDKFGAISEKIYFDLPQRAVSVMFVKNSPVPSLIFNCGRKSFLKTATKGEGATKSTVKIFVSTVSE